ncbi:950b8189-ec1c-4df8-9a77-be5e0b8ac686 [Sclerotinia trifoliorum]|uniref:950b8189-ec1c-4df8-9a77-be5e0b8ac686 n=1 Tax=Sclerotinia trifoliorum TaxID=28548 RepID=A0A8H2VNK2_9HELO|nr:950b8189-ec1c-4df8-9a77-be5e0b8ac686 [Sclerotinia trifoliorum]
MSTTNIHHEIRSNGMPMEGSNHKPPHMIPLPDDSPTRTSSNKLEDQAATAALYITNQNNRKPKPGCEFLDSDNKLSSAGAAASLKYAKPRDLPSYPSAGLKKDQSAAGTAASLGWQNQKTFKHWKPDPSASASAAAMLAKDYKMKPLWQPEASAHGAKAALLAHKANKGVDLWQPEPTAWGNSAATLAMKKGNTLSPQLDYGHTAIGRQGSLLAATGAMSSSMKRAKSTPVKTPKPETYPDEANAASNALRAAKSVHKTQTNTEKIAYPAETTTSNNAMKAAVAVHKSNTVRKPNTFEKGVGSVPYTAMPREMYTSNPPVKQLEQELNKDQNREDVLKASAIAMAKRMYNQQQKQLDAASHAQSGAVAAHGQRRLSIDSDDEPTPMRFNNLQEKAQQLAHERISRMTTEDIQNREYRDYYGGTPSLSSKLSIRGRTRRRASSYDEDRHQSEKIRAQMSLFSSNISQVDEKKRQRDREALLAAAQRKVNDRIHEMDEKVFAQTGKVAPSLLNEWELKAHEAAQAKSEARLENYGKVDIGGGKFVDQSVIDAAAAKIIQPVLDDMNSKADAKRFQDAAMKLDEEHRRRKSQEAKMREKEEKEITKKLKQQEKDEEKERRAEEKAAKKEHRKSAPKSEPDALKVFPIPTASKSERPSTAPTTERIRTSTEDQAQVSAQMSGATNDANTTQQPTSTATSPTSESGSKVKNWLKSKMGRISGRHSKSLSESSAKKEAAGSKKGFVGGHAYTGASVNNSTVSLGQHSVMDVANATILVPGSNPVAVPTKQPEEFERANGIKATAGDDVSSVSDHSSDKKKNKEEVLSGDDDEEEFQEARDNFDEELVPPRPFSSQGTTSSSPGRAPKFHEEI